MVLYNTKLLDEHLESMGEFEDNEDQDGNMDIKYYQNIPQLQTFDDESDVSLLNHGKEVEFIKDKLGRNHIKCPHSGPSVVYLRNNFFHDMTLHRYVTMQ